MFKNNIPLVVTPSRVQAFEELKERICSAPVLGHVKNAGRFVVDYDTSLFACSAVLQQEQEIDGFETKLVSRHRICQSRLQ